MGKYVSETKAGKSVSAWLILNRKGEYVAKVLAHYSDSGVCLVNVFDKTAGFQHATAGGYGYDKFHSALSGMSIDGHRMTDHCSRDNAPKKPKGCKLYPREFKAPKGYSLVNYTRVSRSTGNCFYRYHWIDKAKAELGFTKDNLENNNDAGIWESIRQKAFDLEITWQASDDCETGFSDCYRESGLSYLESIGYRVYQLI